MNTDKKIILEYINSLPDDIVGRKARASERTSVEEKVGTLSDDHWWFLEVVGEAPIGSEWIDGVDQIAESNQRLWSDAEFWKFENVVVVAWDGGGDPVVQCQVTGKVLTSYHDGPQGIHELAPSFLKYLVKLISDTE